MATKTEALPDIRVIKSEVIDTIVKNLGITKAAFFIRENLSIKTDYLEIKEKLFGSKSASELYNEISKWKPKK
ncbi:MAG: hypothetical protein WC769_04585 [Thermodesulfovibrionales bacterium]|jgi:hypothetical protein